MIELKIPIDGRTFAASSLTGFTEANSGWVRQVPGGVIGNNISRSDATRATLVIGGGSGHYPAFAGYVGSGLAQAAVHGDVFASPSAQSIAEVATAASPEGGDIILGYGNYAGDRLNFTAAADLLKSQGHRVEQLVVSDDIASSLVHAERRGVAGDVIVFKMCGAALLRNYDFMSAVSVARRANDRTRTLGMAFSGCTIPGAAAPLFTVEQGTVALGLGIHGEPGLESLTMPESATSLASMLVERLVADFPTSEGSRVAVLLNGLGGIGAETLFALWPLVDTELQANGFESVAPLVGQYVSSLDMTGVSLTICQLDRELEDLWLAPASSPALHRPEGLTGERPRLQLAPAEEAAAGQGGLVAEVLARIVQCLAKEEDRLGQLDAIAGDGDHGRGMLAGATAAYSAALGEEDVPSALRKAGAGWAARAGGTSGALWGAMLVAAGEAIETSSPETVWAAGAEAAVARLQSYGGARPGDKTMLDAALPFAKHLSGSVGGSAATNWVVAAAAAHRAAEETRGLVPRSGRAKTHTMRSVGHPDPGAISLALLVTEVGIWLKERES